MSKESRDDKVDKKSERWSRRHIYDERPRLKEIEKEEKRIKARK